jgi:hypothetical protein
MAETLNNVMPHSDVVTSNVMPHPDAASINQIPYRLRDDEWDKSLVTNVLPRNDRKFRGQLHKSSKQLTLNKNMCNIIVK